MKTPAVILAAGASRRLGMPKQLVSVNGEALIHRMARLACGVFEPVLVVLGAEADRVKAALEDLPVVCVRNLDWEEGMASSLRTAISAVPPDARGVLFLVCDQPAVDRPLLEALHAAHRQQPDLPIACVYGGTRGIPAVLPRRDFAALLELRGDRGAKALLQGPEVLEVPFPGGELDLDRPEDLERLQCFF
jgi:CTP:molybdopterin cytidylyltransferase MocA